MEAYLGSLYSTRALTKKEEPNVCCDAQDKYIFLHTLTMFLQVGLHVWLSHPVHNLLVVFASFQEFIMIL